MRQRERAADGDEDQQRSPDRFPSAALGRLLSSLQFVVRSFAVGTVSLTVGVFGLESTIAALIPALRSTRVQPMTAFRAE